jgi:hypothetical protein
LIQIHHHDFKASVRGGILAAVTAQAYPGDHGKQDRQQQEEDQLEAVSQGTQDIFPGNGEDFIHLYCLRKIRVEMVNKTAAITAKPIT